MRAGTAVAGACESSACDRQAGLPVVQEVQVPEVERCDHVVVGAGSAGCVLAARLVRGNTDAPTIMIAERAADLVRGAAPVLTASGTRGSGA